MIESKSEIKSNIKESTKE